MKVPSVECGKQLIVGAGEPKSLGKGTDVIRGSSYIEGPLEVGDDDAFDDETPVATVMIGPETNTDLDVKGHAKRSLHVKGNVKIDGNDLTSNALNIEGDTNQTGNITASGTILGGSVKDNGGNVLSSKKDFDIPHPTKEGHRLRHVCLEGPEAAVYVRGRVCNGKNIIDLPDYWDGLVDYETLTVQLTALHSHQNVIVKRISPMERRIYLQSQGGMPVDCFYHIMAERKDGERLIPEYEGKSIEDYPGDNREYTHNK